MIVTFSSSCRSAVIILLLTASHLTHFLSTSSVHTSATPSLALTSMLTPEYFKRYLSSSVSSPFPFFFTSLNPSICILYFFISFTISTSFSEILRIFQVPNRVLTRVLGGFRGQIPSPSVVFPRLLFVL
uniref:Secreted protein n=1 Tax=Cacopsylla melanoneura TaxID=428564 RepID=A0A8D8PLS6_9HEMI